MEMSFLHWCFGSLLFLLIIGPGCQKSPVPPRSPSASAAPWFEDITAKSGLNFLHDPGPPPDKFFYPQINASGCAFLDYDNDGRFDILLIQNGGPDRSPHRLYHREADGTYKDVSAGSGLDVTGYGMGCAVGDINNDGLVDVLITEYRNARLFLNLGGGKFREITKEVGLDNPIWTSSAAFFDYDRDGWLDVVIANYVDWVETEKCYDRAGNVDYCGPLSSPGTVSKLFHNLGRAGNSNLVRFEDVTVKSGLTGYSGAGLGVICADFDGDGWPDILISNDAKPNCLWMNQRNGIFRNEALQRGIAYNEMGNAQANMGIALGDVNNDGMFDIYITHLTEENNILWTQGPRGQFQDRTAMAKLATPGWHATGFGTLLVDFDHDGFVDLATVNGRVRRPSNPNAPFTLAPELGAHWSIYGERNQLFSGDGTGKFMEISLQNPAFCGTPTIGRGLVSGDIDDDGAIDLLVSATAQPARLYRNVAPKRGHWLMIRAVEPALGGRDAYGAEITLQTTAGQRVGWIIPSWSYASSSDPRVHFGLGPLNQVEGIQVLWPEGVTETFPGTGVDRVIVLRKGEGKGSSPSPQPGS